ncbi:alpha/beta hydrolase-fold protein [Candidatus Soleaferrea massiliensis]|uniref:alpha/beta hydrolase-fold protein n=1 Tax=Candidatus Soleaferrea massiliensis TaxID=1470354 RepID=UPI00058F069A|nr:alpha/beta hydrolase-fold protein [Candidatus Soleaferrea massiliensis]
MKRSWKNVFAGALAAVMALGAIPSAAFAAAEPVYQEGVTVQADKNSPTGYTATFVYKDASAQSVQLAGDQFYFYTEREGQSVKHTPYEWTKEMFPAQLGQYTEDMKQAGDGVWTLTMPLPSGSFTYKYIVDGEGKTDPANKPLVNTENGREANHSVVYMPFDAEKQVDDRSVQLPRSAQNGKVVFDTYLDGSTARPLAVYLPYGYDKDREEPYKVIYLSHGGGGHELDWMNDGCVPNIMDNLVAEGKTEPAIVVTMNNQDYDWDFADIIRNVMDNILPFVEENYNASSSPSDRAFAGLSMGGMTTAALYYAHPTAFDYFGIWSAGNTKDINFDELKNLDYPTLMIGYGLYDMAYKNDIGGISVVELLEKLDELGIAYGEYPVLGAHDWAAWPQLFTIFAEDILWNREAPVSKDALSALIEKAEKLDRSLYTKASVSALDTALEAAKDVLDDDQASQKQVDAAAGQLQKAIDCLVKLSASGSKPNPSTGADACSSGMLCIAAVILLGLGGWTVSRKHRKTSL